MKIIIYYLLCFLFLLPIMACSKEKVITSLPNDIKEDTANIIFIMDDGWETQYTDGYRILDKYKLKGNIGVISEAVGTPGYADEDQLQEMYDRGWDLLNHTKTHADLSTLSKEKQREEIIEAKKWLKNKGYTRGEKAFLYPYGSYNDVTLEVLKEEGFLWARTVLDGENYELSYEAKTLNLVTSLDPELVKDRVDAAIENKSTLLFMTHKYGDEVDEYDMFYDVKSFEEIVSYVSEKQKQGELNVLTVSEYLEISKNKKTLKQSFVEPILYEDLSKEEKQQLIDDKWLIVWNEDFSELDKTKWNLIDEDINYNSELQYYRPENVEIKENSLYLIGKDEDYRDHNYTSGKVTTENKFELMYGKIEFKAKTDYATGSFPAVWLSATDEDYLPEIDIFEAVGKEYGYAFYVNHWREGEKLKNENTNIQLTDPEDFHTYSIEWNKDEIKWFVDDEHIFTSTEGIPNESMYLIMNLVIGGNWPGSPNEKTKFPINFVIKDLKVMKEVTK
ncbi:family 16 glycosylhydrolase [Bacillus sp. AGMB 02131]|uniref:Family 16 glycosylhydrolase n=1 Tax=Peribacillus faecalis TaxID=2772559 RepID=A0A927HCA5_9BACI|nr:family 16 glycosylhydrolase [Peribacillus faecalis]MBD3109824.1 family 16 glycosylhydrolase [Peribacillus faecalis]